MNKTISKEQYKGMAVFTPIICGRYWQSLSPGVFGLGWPPGPGWWDLSNSDVRSLTSGLQAVRKLSRQRLPRLVFLR